MRLLQYATALIAGVGAGTIWAQFLVMFEPDVYNRWACTTQVVVLLVPLVTTFLCSLLFSWWTGVAQVVYSIALLTVWIVGDTLNWLHSTCEPMCMAPSLWIWGLGLLAIETTWAVARGMRRAFAFLSLRRDTLPKP